MREIVGAMVRGPMKRIKCPIRPENPTNIWKSEPTMKDPCSCRHKQEFLKLWQFTKVVDIICCHWLLFTSLFFLIFSFIHNKFCYGKQMTLWYVLSALHPWQCVLCNNIFVIIKSSHYILIFISAKKMSAQSNNSLGDIGANGCKMSEVKKYIYFVWCITMTQNNNVGFETTNKIHPSFNQKT